MRARTRHLDVIFEPVMRSEAMRRVDRALQLVAGKDVAITLIGESGTGKEVLARRIHELSDRRRGPFVPINCAAIPEALFESELFGHERGAFTGANARAKGKVEAASEGTLFLDEIGEMPLAMQAKLLRFLENRRYMRVGGTTKIQADVRLVFATLRSLEDDVRSGRFRSDLYYRIQGIVLEVPPLRARRADVVPLTQQFVEQLSARHGTVPPKLTRSVQAALASYAWPGNVRELRNVVEMLCLLQGGKLVRVRDLPPALRQSARNQHEQPARELRVSLEQPLEAMIDELIEAVVAAEGGNQTRAAERLRISVRTIQRRLAESKRVRQRRA
ncbi:MAG TPA: sigma 54-interacting transcriptional regulator [Polyangiales bacterium]|nr:sigma 54-interacting transcriptional regulator [Polyangiales bacterium]